MVRSAAAAARGRRWRLHARPNQRKWGCAARSRAVDAGDIAAADRQIGIVGLDRALVGDPRRQRPTAIDVRGMCTRWLTGNQRARRRSTAAWSMPHGSGRRGRDHIRYRCGARPDRVHGGITDSAYGVDRWRCEPARPSPRIVVPGRGFISESANRAPLRRRARATSRRCRRRAHRSRRRSAGRIEWRRGEPRRRG